MIQVKLYISASVAAPWFFVLFFKIYFIFICEWDTVCFSTHGDQKKFDPLELELQVVVIHQTWVLGTKKYFIFLSYVLNALPAYVCALHLFLKKKGVGFPGTRAINAVSYQVGARNPTQVLGKCSKYS